MDTREPRSLLVVDDDTEIRDAIARAFRLQGYRVRTAAGGLAALEQVAADPPDAIVLDVMMPELDGVEVCRRLRGVGDHTPVLLLTARDAVGDRVAGLDAGADDYLVKPFALAELHARMRALLRRSEYDPVPESERLVFEDLELDPESRLAYRGGRTIELTRTEFALLESDAQRRPSVAAGSDLGPDLGLRAGAGVELAGGVRVLHPAQDGGRRRAAARADGARVRYTLRAPA